MIDEIKLFIEMVAGLPSLAVWVLAGYLAYKVVVVGSIYRVIRLLIVKAHDALTQTKKVEFMVAGQCIDEKTASALLGQIARLSDTNYIHMQHVRYLKEALDAASAKQPKAEK